MGFPNDSSGKEPTCQCRRHETWVWSLGWDDPLEKGMATHSSILAWKIPWTEEPCGQSQTQRSDLAHIGIALVYNIICFMYTTLYFYICTQGSVFTPQNLVSIYHHASNPLYPFRPSLNPSTPGIMALVPWNYMFVSVWFGYLLFYFYAFYIPHESESM